MRKRAAWFVCHISSLYWQTRASCRRAGRRRPINGLAAHVTIVFLHRQIKNSILNRKPRDVVNNACSDSNTNKNLPRNTIYRGLSAGQEKVRPKKRWTLYTARHFYSNFRGRSAGYSSAFKHTTCISVICSMQAIAHWNNMLPPPMAVWYENIVPMLQVHTVQTYLI